MVQPDVLFRRQRNKFWRPEKEKLRERKKVRIPKKPKRAQKCSKVRFRGPRATSDKVRVNIGCRWAHNVPKTYALRQQKLSEAAKMIARCNLILSSLKNEVAGRSKSFSDKKLFLLTLSIGGTTAGCLLTCKAWGSRPAITLFRKRKKKKLSRRKSIYVLWERKWSRGWKPYVLQ